MEDRSSTHALDEASGERLETQLWLDHSVDCGYINGEKLDNR
jgi:hypothetical protein